MIFDCVSTNGFVTNSVGAAFSDVAEPEGGFYPAVMLTDRGQKVRVRFKPPFAYKGPGVGFVCT